MENILLFILFFKWVAYPRDTVQFHLFQKTHGIMKLRRIQSGKPILIESPKIGYDRMLKASLMTNVIQRPPQIF